MEKKIKENEKKEKCFDVRIVSMIENCDEGDGNKLREREWRKIEMRKERIRSLFLHKRSCLV